MLKRKFLRILGLVCLMYTQAHAVNLKGIDNNPVIDAFGDPVSTGKWYYIMTEIGAPPRNFNGINTRNLALISLYGQTGTNTVNYDDYDGKIRGPNDPSLFWYFDPKFKGGESLDEKKNYEIRNRSGDHLKGGLVNSNATIASNDDLACGNWGIAPSGQVGFGDVGTVNTYNILNTDWPGALQINFSSWPTLANITTRNSKFVFIPLPTGPNGVQSVTDGNTILGGFAYPSNLSSPGRGNWTYFPNCAGQPIWSRGSNGTFNWDTLVIGNRLFGSSTQALAGGSGPTRSQVSLISQNGEMYLKEVWNSGANDDSGTVWGITVNMNGNDLTFGRDRNRGGPTAFPYDVYNSFNTVVNLFGLTSVDAGGDGSGYITGIYFRVVRLEVPAPEMN